MEAIGHLPVHNWRGAPFPGIKNIHGGAMKDKLSVGMEGCFGCPLRCKKKLKSGRSLLHRRVLRRARIRSHVRAGQQLRGRRGRGRGQGQRGVQRQLPRRHLDGHHHLVRHGVLREGSPDPGRHGRPRPAVRQRSGARGVLRAYRQAGGHRSPPGGRLGARGGQDRPGGGGALGGSEGRPSRDARAAPPSRFRPRLHGQSQRRRPLCQRTRRRLCLRARDVGLREHGFLRHRAVRGHRPAQGGVVQGGTCPGVPQRLSSLVPPGLRRGHLQDVPWRSSAR